MSDEVPSPPPSPPAEQAVNDDLDAAMSSSEEEEEEEEELQVPARTLSGQRPASAMETRVSAAAEGPTGGSRSDDEELARHTRENGSDDDWSSDRSRTDSLTDDEDDAATMGDTISTISSIGMPPPPPPPDSPTKSVGDISISEFSHASRRPSQTYGRPPPPAKAPPAKPKRRPPPPPPKKKAPPVPPKKTPSAKTASKKPEREDSSTPKALHTEAAQYVESDVNESMLARLWFEAELTPFKRAKCPAVLEDYLLPKKIVVGKVSHPRVKGGVFSKRTVFAVRAEGFGETDRSYKEFEWLHNMLQRECRGTIIPPLPPSSRDSEDEMRSLSRFLTRVLRNPLLASSISFRAFMIMVSGGGASKEFTRAEATIVDADWVCAQHSDRIDLFDEPPSDIMDQVSEMIRASEKTLLFLQETKRIFTHLDNRERDVAKVLRRFSQKLVDESNSTAETLANEPSENMTFINAINGLSNAVNLRADLLSKSSVEHLMSRFRDDIALCERIIAALTSIRDYMAGFEAEQERLESMENKIAQADMEDDDMTAKQKKVLQKLTRERSATATSLESARATYERVRRSLPVELRRAKLELNVIIRTAILDFSQHQLGISSKARCLRSVDQQAHEAILLSVTLLRAFYLSQIVEAFEMASADIVKMAVGT